LASAQIDKPKGLSPQGLSPQGLSPQGLSPQGLSPQGLSPQQSSADPFLQPWQFFLLGGMLAATATVIVATGQSPANIIILSMTVVSISFVGLGTYRILAPLVSNTPDTGITIGGRTRIALEREKALVLRSLKELEFDFAMGKMAKADFDEMSGRLRARALGLMRQLDAGGGYREQIAKEIQSRLEGDGFSRRNEDESNSNSFAVSDEAPEHSATAEAVALQTSCEACQIANDVDAKFCKNCGVKL
jgi:hypothetical protein